MNFSIKILSRVWLTSWVLLGGAIAIVPNATALFGSTNSSDTATVGQSDVVERTRPIEKIQVGDRVVAENPLLGEDVRDDEPDPVNWRKITLHINDSRGRHDITLLRPLSWLRAQGVAPGSSIRLVLSEQGIDDDAVVDSVLPCPELSSGEGFVVTGTFSHPGGDNLLALHVEGEREPIVATTTHPFWSEGKRDFVPAGQLNVGNILRSKTGEPSRIVAIDGHTAEARVYNIEVATRHSYFVGHQGVLVHNQKTGDPSLQTPKSPAPRNYATTINGRDYSGHALDRMQERGFVPSVVENAISTGTRAPGNTPGTTVFTDTVNKLRVVINSETGRVVTVIPGVK